MRQSLLFDTADSLIDCYTNGFTGYLRGITYVNPVIDMGYVVPDDFLISSGLELMFILDEWPGAPGRVSYGHNLLDPDEDELTIGCYFFY